MIKASAINTHKDCLLLLKITMKANDRFSNVLSYQNKILAILGSEAEAPILWPPDAKGWLTGKDPEAGRDWGQEKGATEDETLDSIYGLEFEQNLEDSEGQGSLACCSSWSCKELDMA